MICIIQVGGTMVPTILKPPVRKRTTCVTERGLS